MDHRTTVTVTSRIDGDLDDAITVEAERWGVFGTVVAQRHDRATGSVLTTVKTGPDGRRALEGALMGRRYSRLVSDPSIIARSAHV